MKQHPSARARTLRTIAVFEAVKGIAVLAASFGLLDLLRHDVRHLARVVIAHFGMQPDAHYPAVLLHYADILADANLRFLVLLAMGYASVRLLEAYGIWKELAWGEWLGALSGAIYIPFEIQHFIHKHSILGAVVFAGNVFVVGFLAFQLYRRRGLAAGLQPRRGGAGPSRP